MLINKTILCEDLPCEDINKNAHYIPQIELKPEKVQILMICEVIPENSDDYFYSKKEPSFMETILQAFNDAEQSVKSTQDILLLGFYLFKSC